MTIIRILTLLLAIGATGFAAYNTFSGKGANSLEHPAGLSLREESTRGGHGGFFMLYNTGRSHRSGGIHTGK